MATPRGTCGYYGRTPDQETPVPVARSLMFALCLGAALGAALADSARADNWPRYRGRDRSGVVREQGLAADWPAEGPREIWRARAGIGFASPVAADGRVYLFYLADNQDVLEAFDAASGKSLWRQTSPTRYTGSYAGTRCTPVIDGDRLYTHGASGELIGRDRADGKQLWSLDVLTETGNKLQPRPESWGNSSDPLVDGDAIYVQARDGGNAAVRVDKNSGKIVWRSDAKGGGYASPVLAPVGERKLLLCFANKHLLALDPDTGKTLWELQEDWEIEYDINAALPIVHDGKVFLTCANKNGHCGLYELSGTGAKKIWGGRQIVSLFQAPVLDDGYLYGNTEGKLTCVRWSDGNVMWSSKDKPLGVGGSVLRFGGDRLITLSDRGVLGLWKATPQAGEKLRTLKRFVEGDQVWATALIYDKKLFLKAKDELIAYDVSAK